jgi:hypothetical protein
MATVVFQHWLDDYYTISSVVWSDNSETMIDIPIYQPV